MVYRRVPVTRQPAPIPTAIEARIARVDTWLVRNFFIGLKKRLIGAEIGSRRALEISLQPPSGSRNTSLNTR